MHRCGPPKPEYSNLFQKNKTKKRKNKKKGTSVFENETPATMISSISLRIFCNNKK